MTCPRCTRRNPEEAQWCVYCGSPLEGPDPALERVSVEVQPRRIPVPAGGEATAVVQLRSLGDLVGRFVVRLQGPAAAFARLDADTVRLLPGEAGSVTLRVAPPRSPSPAAGTLPVVVDVHEGDGHGVLAQGEGEVDIQPFHELVARVVPSSARAWRSRTYRVELQNHGNTEASVRAGGSDPDDALTIAVAPAELRIAPAERAELSVDVRARSRRLWGPPVELPFSVALDQPHAEPVVREARLVQRALIPKLALVLAVLAAALLAAGIALEKVPLP